MSITRCTQLLLVLLMTLGWAVGAYSFDAPWDTGHLDVPIEDTPDSENVNDDIGTNDPCTGASVGHNESASHETGSPVVVKDGSLIWTELDVVVDGRFPLYVKRTFSSSNSTRGIFGKGWTSNCERTLSKTFSASAADLGTNPFNYVLRLASGKVFEFGDESTPTARPRGIQASIEEVGNTIVLTWVGGKVDVFEDGRLISERDSNGNGINYVYSGERLSRMTTTDGRSLSFSYHSGSGFVRSVSDNTGRSWSYGYDSRGNLTSVTSPSGTRTYSYLADDVFSGVGAISDLFAFLTSVNDETNVRVLGVEYNTTDFHSVGRVESYSRGLDRFEYELHWSTGEIPARIVQIDKRGAGGVWNYYLDEEGKIFREVAPYGEVILELNDDFQSTVTQFNTGYELRTTYDNMGRPVFLSDGRASYRYAYSSDNLVPSTITLPNQLGSVQYRFDSSGNVTEYEDLQNNVYRFKYNQYGDLTEITLPNSEAKWLITYNNVGLVESITSPLQKRERFIRDNRGNIEKYINGNNKEWVFTHDELGRKLTELTPEGILTEFSYDDAGRLVSVTNNEGEVYQKTYDGYGRLASTQMFWGGMYTYDYYPSTYRVSSLTNPAGQSTQYFYNNKNLLRRKEGVDQFVDYEYDAYGRLIRAENNVGVVAYEYSRWDEILSETVNGVATSYLFDDLGRLVQETRFSSDLVMGYDAGGRLSSILTPAGLLRYEYDDWNRLTDILRPNNINTSISYNLDSKIVGIQHGSIENLTYIYDDAGRITGASGLGFDNNYLYDDDNRLISVSYSPALPDGTSSEEFQYNDLGDRIGAGERYGLGSQLQENDEYVFTYSENGNVVSKKNKLTGVFDVFTYNSWNQLVSFERYQNEEASIPLYSYSYNYGPVGRRWEKESSSGLESYYWAGTNLIAQESGGSLKVYYPESFSQSGDYFYPLSDILGATKSVLSYDGDIVWSGVSKAFGETLVTSGAMPWNRRFPGQIEDSESGNHYNLRRDYDPKTGRYLQSDPIGVAGGTNLYAYANNNPISNIDPRGEASLAAEGALVVTVGGLIAYGSCGGSSNPWCQAVRDIGDRCLASIGAVFNENGEASEDAKEGEFEITDWDGYPEELDKPEGPFRPLEGDEYEEARKKANNANRKLRRREGVGSDKEVHEIKPVKFNGSPTNRSNKAIIDKDIHRRKVTPWWNKLMKDLGF